MKKTVIGIMLTLSFLAIGQARATESSQPLVVIALAKVKPEYVAVFREAATRILGPTRQESGNLRYDFHQSTEDTTEFSTYENWISENDLAGHMASNHMQKFFQEVGAMFENGYPVIKKFMKFEKP